MADMPSSQSKRGIRVRGVLLRRKTLRYFLSDQFKAPCYRCGRRYRWKYQIHYPHTGGTRHYCCHREGLA